MTRKASTEELIRKILGEDYLALNLDRYELTEDVSTGGACCVAVTLSRASREGSVRIEGEGVGFVDAVFNALTAHYAREFESLETIAFIGFQAKGQMETGHAQNADAVAVVTLSVKNSEGHKFTFEEQGRSLVAASAKVVILAVEYFVNSERAFILTHRALIDARERQRADLVQSYTSRLSDLVNVTSYTKVIERIRAEALRS